MSSRIDRVLYVVSLFPCWSETFIVREIQGLLDRGVDVQIASLKPPSEKLVQAHAERMMGRVHWARGVVGLPVALVEFLRHPLIVLQAVAVAVGALWRHPMHLLKTLATYYAALTLMPAVRRFAPRHVHAHWATYASSAAWLTARLAGVPFSYTSHAHDLFLEDHFIARKIIDSKFSITISRYNQDLIARRYGNAVADKVQIVHCGVDPAEFDAGTTVPEPRRMLAVGRLDEIKGFDVLVAACAEMAARGVEFNCDIIGEGPQRPELEREIARHGLAGRVNLLGVRKQEEVRAAMLRAGIFVLPSVVTSTGNMDGIPVALMEAMALRRACVSTYVSGIPELIKDDASGLLVAERDATALANALDRLLGDAALCERLGTAARATVMQSFTAHVEAGKLLALMERA